MYRVSVDCFDRHTLVVVEDCLCYHRPFVNDVPICQNQAALLVHNKPARQWGLYGEEGEDKQKFLNVTVSLSTTDNTTAHPVACDAPGFSVSKFLGEFIFNETMAGTQLSITFRHL